MPFQTFRPPIIASVPTSPAIDLPEPGGDIVLYDGPGAIDGRPMQIRVVQPLISRLRVHVEPKPSEELIESFPLGDTTVELHDTLAGQATFAGNIVSSSGRVELDAVEIGSHPIATLVAHMTNLPTLLPGRGLKVLTPAEQAEWTGRWTATGAGWDVTVDVLRNHSALLDAVSGTNKLAVTHIATLARTDGSAFAPADGRDALYAVQLAFTTAFGTWTAPVGVTGFDSHGNRAHEQAAAWFADPYTPGTLGWCSGHNGLGLAAWTGALLEAFSGAEREAVVHLARHLIAANHTGTTTEGRIMLAQAALEYDAWLTFVLSGRVSKNQYKNQTAEAHLRDLLLEARIPTAIPDTLPDAQQLAVEENLTDGPAVITWVRNRLTHPKNAREPYELDDLVAETWRLSIEYLNLRLMHRLGYAGEYRPTTWIGPFVHDRVKVPWAT